MPSDFSQTSVSMSAKRTYTAPITVLANFTSAVNAFLADTTMGLTKNEKKSESYKVPVAFFNSEADEKGRVVVTAETAAAYTDAVNMVKADQDLADVIAGTDADISEVDTEALWNVKISCELNGDTFSVNFNRTYATISGYSNAETLSAIETWFDNNASVA